MIDKILIKFINCKYIIKLNIIAIFNKFKINLINENLMIFVYLMKIYKYYILLFELINKFFNYQYYINNVFFEFFNNFVQCYLNDIFIYNKIKKKHICHVRIIFQKFINIDFQINIQKNQFYVQKIEFLNIIIFIKNICINFKKIQIIVD